MPQYLSFSRVLLLLLLMAISLDLGSFFLLCSVRKKRAFIIY
jgi:hypothetical protein